MKTTKNNSNTKKYLIIAGIALLVIGTGTAVYAFNSSTTNTSDKSNEEKPPVENQQNYEKPTDEQIETGNNAKEDFIDRTEGEGSTSDVRVSITSIQQEQGVLSVRSLVETAQAQGECKLVVERSGQQSIEQTAELQSMGSYSVCKGFDVPTGGMVKGEWKVTISYTLGTASVNDSRTVVIQ